jgi:adenylyltransferase/sulfurtransferase
MFPGVDDTQLLRYSRHLLLDALGPDAQARFAGRTRADRRRRGTRQPRRAIPRERRDRAADARRCRQRRSHQPAAPDPVRPLRRRRPKVEAAAKRLAAINPEPTIVALARRVDADDLASLVSDADVVLDCTDNFATRHAINRACVAARVPLVSGAAIRFDGQVAVFDPRDPLSPCYHCLFGEGEELEETRCATMGVFAPLVGIVGAAQAGEALKLVAGVGTSLAGRLLIYDALASSWRELKVPRDPSCAVCGSRS